MEIELTPEQDAFIQHLVETGRYQSPAAAIHRAMELWVERERTRLELIEAIEEGERSLEAGEFVDLDSDEAIAEMIEGVKRRGRASLAASDAA
jgi:putative addiction module CopG family antidote